METSIASICINEKALIFGGAYGNLQATKAILSYAEAHDFLPEQLLFTGDLVAYCGQPQETVDLIRQYGCHILMGNCEESLALGRDDCGCGFDEDTECNLLSMQWFSFCQQSLNEESKAWMGTLPRSAELQLGPFRFFCTHGTTSTINEFVFPSQVRTHEYSIPHQRDIDGYIVGHSGIPFITQQEHAIWINSGAAGMPANDGSPRVWFATLQIETDGLSVQTHAIEYEKEEAVSAMDTAGLTNGYRDCLLSGIWPSHDVLPKFERDQTGKALRPQKSVLKASPLSVAV